jgi:hypothetical protein
LFCACCFQAPTPIHLTINQLSLHFLPGEFVRWEVPNGSALGRILSVDEASILVSCWAVDGEAATMRDFFLPPLIYDGHIVDVIPKPTLSSLIFVHHAEDFLSF